MISSPSDNPAVAYSAQAGSWLVAWQDGYDPYISARSVDGSGNLGTTFTVSPAKYDESQPDVSANDQGGFLVVWEWADAETGYGIDARRTTSTGIDGSVFGIAQSAVSPKVTYNPDDDEYLVVWQELRELETIQGQRVLGEYDPQQGQFAGNAFQVNSGVELDCGLPDVTYFAQRQSQQGVYLVAWELLKGGGELDLQARRVLTDGTLTGSILTVSDAEGDQADVALAFGPGVTETLAAWTDGRAGNDDVYARVVEPDGTMGSDLIVHPAPGDQNMPEVAYNPDDDEYLVTWQDYRHGVDNPDIYAQRISGDGMLLGENITVTNAPYRQIQPKVAYAAGQGVYLVVWRDYPNVFDVDYNTYGRIISHAGGLIGDRIAISNYGSKETPSDIVYNEDTTKFLVLWQDARDYAWNIWGRHVSTEGGMDPQIQITFLNRAHATGAAGAYNHDDDQYLITYAYCSSTGQPHAYLAGACRAAGR